jgi:hypothetical protein
MLGFYSKLIGPAVAALVLASAVWTAHHRGYVSGVAYETTKFDQYVKQSDLIAAHQDSENAKLATIVQANNAAQINDYKRKLADSTLFGQSVSRQLRLALAKAGGGGVPQGENQPGTSVPGSEAGVGEIADAVGRTAAECRANADQLDALLNEISPQL